MACPDLIGIQVDIDKAVANGWNHPDSVLVHMFSSDLVTGGIGPSGENVLVRIFHDETNLITLVTAEDNADPPNMYTCVCPPEPPQPCYEFSEIFTENVLNDIIYEGDGNGGVQPDMLPIIIGIAIIVGVVLLVGSSGAKKE